MKRDIRTPTRYYTDPNVYQEDIGQIRTKINVLSEAIDQLNNERATPSQRMILENELSKLEQDDYNRTSKLYALRFVEELLSRDSDIDVAIERLKECLDYKAFKRTEHLQEEAGGMMELQIFRADK